MNSKCKNKNAKPVVSEGEGIEIATYKPYWYYL
jgi:hypothetical protein